MSTIRGARRLSPALTAYDPRTPMQAAPFPTNTVRAPILTDTLGAALQRSYANWRVMLFSVTALPVWRNAENVGGNML